jgi:hypothetical protein
MRVTRASALLDRMYKRRGLHKVERVRKQNKRQRTALYAKMDRKLDRMRHGLKELIADTLSMRKVNRRGFSSVPDCPKMRYVGSTNWLACWSTANSPLIKQTEETNV